MLVTVPAEATVVWLAPEPADAASRRALATWARGKGITLVSPREAVRRTPMTLDMSISAAVEDRLETARDSLASLAGIEVDRALDSARALLVAHPELPNAAWLMAEVERARSVRLRRIAPVDLPEAERSWSKGAVLGGERAPGRGETPSPPGPRAVLTLQLRPEPETRIWMDGVALETKSVETAAGPHALVVTWHESPIWASWIDLPAGLWNLSLPALDAPPCSMADLQGAHATNDAGIIASLVQCGHWVAATSSPTPGAVRVATCEGDRCSALTEWRAALDALPISTGNVERSRTRWPGWATWTLIGTGAAIAGGITFALAAGGAQGSPSETRWIVGPVKSP